MLGDSSSAIKNGANVTVKTRCSNADCRQSYLVDEEKLGKQGRCKKCGMQFTFEPTNDTKAPVQQTQAESQGTIPVGSPLRDLKKLGRFEIKNRLGAGAFGEVFRAHDPQLDRDVELKVPHPAVLQNPKVAKRFLIEARATARLTHPNIVPVFDAGQESGHHYIASAFIEGKTLDDALADSFDFRETARIVMKLAGALAYAHEQGIVHRDIKPANIMLDAKGEPHLMDFGLARLETGTENLTHDDAILGTPAYMPPEQAAGDLENVSAASDQYSLGVTLYEMLCGERPFSRPPEIVIFNVINQEPPAPRTLKPDVPRDLETICQKAMAKEQSARYKDGNALAEDLRRWLDDEPIHARPLGHVERMARWAKKNPMLSISAASSATLLLLVAIVSFLGYLFTVDAQSHAKQQSEAAEAERKIAQEKKEEAIIEKKGFFAHFSGCCLI